VGSFGQIRTPGDLPSDGLIPADWDGQGRPATAVQVELGWSLVYEPDGRLWVYMGAMWPQGEWFSPAVVQGPPGKAGPAGVQGPAGPQGPEGQPGPATAYFQSETTSYPLAAGATAWTGITRQWIIPAGQVIPGSWFVVEVAGSGIAPNTFPGPDTSPHIEFGHRVNTAQAVRVLALRFANMPVSSQVGVVVRAVYQVHSPTQMYHWNELVGLSPRPGTPQITQGNNAAGAISAVEPSALTPGADLTIGVSAHWQTNVGGQVLTFQGSRLSRYVAAPVAASRAYDVLTRRPALI
jgi:hypothetical protein